MILSLDHHIRAQRIKGRLVLSLDYDGVEVQRVTVEKPPEVTSL